MNQEIKNREDIAPSYKWNIDYYPFYELGSPCLELSFK